MTDSFLRAILWNSLFLCALLYIDTYLVPREERPEQVISQQVYRNRSRRSSNIERSWVIHTDRHTYDVSSELYSDADIGDTLTVQYSKLLHAMLAIETNHEGIRTNYPEGYLYHISACIFVPALMIAILVMLPMVARIDYQQGKINLTICLAIMALGQLIFYFDLF